MKMRHRSQIFCSFLLLNLVFIAAVAFHGTAVRAEMKVISSTSESAKVDDIVTEATNFDIEADAQVLVLKVDEGTTHLLKGPFKGTLKQYEAQAESCSSIWDRLMGNCGTDDESLGTRSVGGIRGLAPPRDEQAPAPVGGTRGIR